MQKYALVCSNSKGKWICHEKLCLDSSNIFIKMNIFRFLNNSVVFIIKYLNNSFNGNVLFLNGFTKLEILAVAVK